MVAYALKKGINFVDTAQMYRTYDPIREAVKLTGINLKGIGILGGSVDDMKLAIEKAAESGKGILIMKALGGGALLKDYKKAMDFVRSLKCYHSIAIGMVSQEEVDFNVNYFNGIYQEEKLPAFAKEQKKFMVMEFLCKGCKSCVETCPNLAIEYDEERKKARINEGRCLTCGYCTASCPEFAIRAV